ncbi:ZYRO0C07810p [Zygosaccharomyces rouxii]|uniref:ZYRO0C07810p n=1 Tax=Zygosaccharomyces rouxii (strain ATCC 2623 / CBS 732 / NBRC 1130 / NCYC 568 / NRRL Y-229) TaxID=559307 RepID=C5DTE1_ZYGRC|nr:uncharacterized protein ZYRO0C07810g [Zygosaccharomyces rouxii]KAH9201767.1 hypothetical protein LQ764DRAFT_233487 [Zygosaccharomyces rouxii]CAR27052.1 ZYRO0C07810p [Zygosaccharomyces rouxii]
MAYHIPVLLNPLVNSVFNCSNPSDSQFKKLFGKLKTERFILLVPPTEKLLYHVDAESGSSMNDLCQNYDFVASHILLLQQDTYSDGGFNLSASQTEYKTLNDKRVAVRSSSGEILTTEGFPLRRRARIQNVELITNFNDYLNGSEKFALVHIDHPLIGTLIRKIDIPRGLAQGNFNGVDAKGSLVRDLTQKSWSSFENILRLHPDWSNILNGYFNRYRSTPLTEGPYEELFRMIVKQVHAKMVNDELFRKIPHLYDLIFDYVELNLFDDVWIRIVNSYRKDEIDTEPLKFLSINELETELYQKKYEKFRLQDVTTMEKNIDLAINSFVGLPLTHTHAEKADCLINTLQSLSNTREQDMDIQTLPITMDADTLISFFVLVVCRTQVKNIKSHLFYLKKFSKDENSIKFGILGYAISTLEAVVFYFDGLKGTKKLQKLQDDSNKAKELYILISDKSTGQAVLDISQFRSNLEFRTPQGESVLSQCIINDKNGLLYELLKNYEDIFPLEDILDDETVDGSTLLIQALKCDNSEAAQMIVEVLQNSCTEQELREYVNRADKNRRTVAHYLTHEMNILESIGKYINWKSQDSNGHTPLFTIFRCYDQQNYEAMISAAFRSAVRWYQANGEDFQFSDHEDNKGNTLLHIIKNNVSILLDYDNVDINCTNKKGLTPLMIYTRYNRFDNVKTIIRDQRIILDKLQHPSFLNSFDYARNPLVLKELVSQAIKTTAFELAFVHHLKYEAPSWFFHITVKIGAGADEEYKTVKLHIKTLQNLFQVLLKMHFASFLPLEKALEDLSNLYKSRMPSIAKLETLYFFYMLTDCFDVLLRHDNLNKLVLRESRLVSWIRSQDKKCNNSKKLQKQKNVEPEEIGIMASFLRFNRGELSAVKLKLMTMKKLLIFLKLKNTDLTHSYQFLSLFGTEYNLAQDRLLFKDLEINCCAFGEEATMTFVREIAFLENCTGKLLDRVEQLLSVDIPEWWKLYGDVLEMHKVYKQKFPNISRNDSGTGIIASFFEGKREKMESKLSSDLADCKKRMRRVGDRISSTHEILAEELSKYMEFKSNFFINGILRRAVRENINILKGRLVEMRKRALYRSRKGENNI